MGPFGALLWISHYAGLLLPLNASGDVELDNHISGNALFTEVPHDVITQSGQDVEMACSFRGSGSSSVLLEIQWWYLRHLHKWAKKPAWTTNQVVPIEEMTRDATKISVVKVAGSNISHRLRLSSVKPADEGIYECRVIDFSNNHEQHHTVRAYLQVQPPDPDSQLLTEESLNHGEQILHHSIKHPQQQNHKEQEPIHRQTHHKKHPEVQATEAQNDSPSTLYHEDHHQIEHHHLHEGKNHQENKHTQSSKKSQIKNHESNVEKDKEHAKEYQRDCSTHDCVL
ncbi:V-set and transmembrane domain-containing protein 2-like protein [Trichomycterus rosablanca]|uniref:V-set and transmembrane domain-containing protein 2-like protein n=1 Tax=Trichomycterus rosablanca TaxID=2290929 RepID=UPI002F3569BF